jgi:hypothetical protein
MPFKAMVGDALMDWLSIVSAVLGGIVGGLSGYIANIMSKPRFEYVNITHSSPSLPTSPTLSTFHQFLLCGARFRVTWLPHRLKHEKLRKCIEKLGLGERLIARNSMGWIGIYDDQGKQIYGSRSVWLPDNVSLTWSEASIIANISFNINPLPPVLPISDNVVGEGTLLLFLIYPSDIKSSNDSALIILPDPSPGVTTWQLIPFSSPCFKYNGYSGTPICIVAGSLWPNYKVRFRVASENAHGIEKEFTLSELLNSCINSVQ